MKRSEVVLKMARFHTQKYVMVEQNYITKLEFFSEMLQLVEELGMRPPYDASQDDGVDTFEWDEE
jgi:hypothetical protein